MSRAELTARWSLKPQVTGSQPLERRPVGAYDVRVDRLRGCHQPCVVLSHAAGCASLPQRASSRLSQVQPLNREPLQGRQRRRLVGRSLQEFFHRDNRNGEPAAPQRRQKPPRRALLTSGGPGTSSQTIAFYLWEQVWVFNKYSFGAAASIVLLLIFAVLIFFGIYMLVRQRAIVMQQGA